MKLFVKEAISSIKNVGAVAPSSKFLANTLLKDVSFNENQVVLEFGAGNGAITKHILKQLPPNSRLISLEISDSFLTHCQQKFSSYSNFEIYNHSAVQFDTLLDELKIEKIDYLISSLPISILPDGDLEKLFEKIPKYLNTNGRFLQYQYSLGKYKYLKGIFGEVQLGFTLTNIPPAFVYRCSCA